MMKNVTLPRKQSTMNKNEKTVIPKNGIKLLNPLDNDVMQ